MCIKALATPETSPCQWQYVIYKKLLRSFILGMVTLETMHKRCIWGEKKSYTSSQIRRFCQSCCYKNIINTFLSWISLFVLRRFQVDCATARRHFPLVGLFRFPCLLLFDFRTELRPWRLWLYVII